MIPEHKLDPDPEPKPCTRCEGRGQLSECCHAPIETDVYGDSCVACLKECDTEACDLCCGTGVSEQP
jgi:hypothetical protein